MPFAERTFEFDGIPVSYVHGGTGYPILMIHGSGPGASTLGNWRRVLEPLAERYQIFAMDLIGFGKSGRKREPPFFDFQLWYRQCEAMLKQIPGETVGIIGHSVSGALALKLCSAMKRVNKVMTTGTMGAKFEPNKGTVTGWTFPKNRRELVDAASTFIFDKSLIDDAYLSNREKVLFSGDYQAYFSAMFTGDKRQFIDQAVISDSELRKISCDVLMVHGRNDGGFPAEALTLAIKDSIPHADVVLLGRCSHSVAFEHPEKFIALAKVFFN